MADLQTSFPNSSFSHGFGDEVVTGLRIYVDSGRTNATDGNDGETPREPMATLNGAINKVSANNGDHIYLMPGHSETISADAATDPGPNLTVAGVTVIGLGKGADRPTFDFDNTAADFKLNAANCRIHNILFTSGVNSQVMCIEVSGTDCEISHCEFRSTGGTNEFLIPISIGLASNDSDRLWVHDCIFISDTAAATSAIAFAQLHADVRIEDCTIRGDWSDAGIQSAVIQTDCIIRNNLIRNDNAGEHCIQFSTTATGVIQDNTLLNDVYSLAIDPGSCDMTENRWIDPAVDTGSIPFPPVGLDAVTAGALPQVVFTGERFFVDSGHADASDTVGFGTSPASPFATVDFANNQCTADNGDVIYAMPGHNENFAGTDDIDLDTAGVSLIGLGSGDNVPRFDYDATASEIVIGASGVLIENIRLRPGLDTVTNAINIEAGGDFFTIRNVRFGDAEAATDEFADAIIVEAAADNGIIEQCHFESGAQAAVSCIELNGAVLGLKVRDNYMVGDYSTACIRGDTTASQAVIIENNLLWNGVHGGLGTVAVISLNAGTTGVIRNNDIACNLADPSLSIVADTCLLFGNNYQETTGVGVGGVASANAQHASSRTVSGINPLGDVWYVAASGGSDGATPQGSNPRFPLATVAQAITNAAAGDTIVLGPGSHAVDVSAAALIPLADMQFVGAIPSYGARPSTRLTHDADDGADLVTIDVDGVMFKDIDFLTVAGGTNAIRSIDISATTAVNGLTFVDCWFDLNSVDAAGITAINLDDATNVTTGLVVKNCRFVGGDATTNVATYIDIGVRGMTNGLIEDCMFSCESTDDDCAAIAMADLTTTGRGHGFVIRNNDFIGPTDGAVTLVPITTAGSSGELVGCFRTNYFSHTSVNPVAVDIMDESLIRNYVGDLTIGGTIVDAGT